MIQATRLLLFLLLTTCSAHAQVDFDWGKYAHSFLDKTTDRPTTVGIITAIPKPNDSYWNPVTDNALYALATDSLFRGVPPDVIVARTTYDTNPVHFLLHGVTAKNADQYEFRVKTYPADSVLIPWGSPQRFTKNRSDWPQMAYLGGFAAPLGHLVSVEVRRVGRQQLVGVSLAAWVPVRPAMTSLYTSNNLDAFLKKLEYPWARETDPGPGSLSGRIDTPADPLTLPATNTNLIVFLNAAIYSKTQVQYELIRDGEVVLPWKNNDYDNSFVWLNRNVPGSYRLNLRYTVQPQHVTSYYFRIEPAWYQSNRFKMLVGVFVAVCLGAGTLLVLFVRQKQKSRRELADKTKLQLELKAIYAQLNPHFVFNALSSIQGLVNKRDMEGANNYLTDFARLMRESLANSHKDEVSLDEEIQLLDTYLRLEQLRFGFQYQISLDPAINRFNTSIPALLVQPLVENAVKHGASALQEVGRVTIDFQRTGDAMIVCIIDNGQGFVADRKTGGFGLKLTRDRVRLLTELNRAQSIHFESLNHLLSGAEARLSFTHWFA